MKKKSINEIENNYLQKIIKNDPKIMIHRKINSNSNFQKENKMLISKLSHLDYNNNNNLILPSNLKAKNNLNLLPIKKGRNLKENEINAFSLFFNGENNLVSPKNEVNLITTQYNYGNNLLLIHKTSKDLSSQKLQKNSFNNNINNNTLKDDVIEEKPKTNINIGNKLTKRNIILKDLKNKKNIISELKNIKEIRETLNETHIPPTNNLAINNNTNLNIIKFNNNISTKKLPALLKIKKNNLINNLRIPPRKTLITPLIQNKNYYNRKKSEIIKRKAYKKESKENKDDKDITFGKNILWKKISLLKEGENCYIYQAFNITNGYMFIVKEYKLKNKESRTKKLFYNEVHFLKCNKQKNIVEYKGAEVVNNTHFYIYLNFLGGYNLKEFYSKVGFFTKTLLIGFIEQIIHFLDYMKLKGLVYNNFSFDHILFDLDGTIKIIDFSKVTKQKDMIKYHHIKFYEDVDFIQFKNMILNIIYYEKTNNSNNGELSNDIHNFCNTLETSLINTSNLSEFKSNYSFKNKEETMYMKNSSINFIN